MRIIDVAEFYSPQGGGVRTYIEQKLRAAAAGGHELLVIAPGERDAIEHRFGGRIAWVASAPMPFDPRYRLLVRERAVHALIDQEAPDIIEGSSPWTGGWMAARYRARALGAGGPRKCFVFHQDAVAVYPQTLFGRWLGVGRVDQLCAPYWSYLRRLSHRFDATIVSGEWLARRLADHGIRRPIAVPFGVDKTLFCGARPDAALRASLLARAGAAPDAALLVAVSRHHPEKRLGTLFQAIELLSRRRPIALIVYGDGPLAGYNALRARGLPIHLAGVTHDRQLLSRVLASADALLHGSSAETFGLAIAEALCAALPIVVPDVGGAAALADPSYAETYPAGDARACADAVLRLLAREPQRLRCAAATFGRTHLLSQGEHFDRLFETYLSLARARESGSAPSGDRTHERRGFTQ
jgi:alpha-1,6-mannosyltransferase